MLIFFFFYSALSIHVLLTDNQRGMAVAGRLSEDPSITVAVLEAGMNVEDLPEVLVDTITTNPLYTHRKIRCLSRV